MTMWHVNKNLQVEQCRANTRECPLGNGMNYSSPEKAQKAAFSIATAAPRHPADTEKGHTFDSLAYHADNNQFSILSSNEASAPRGIFVVKAKFNGVPNLVVMKGEWGSRTAKVVGRVEKSARGRRAFVGSELQAGREVEDVLYLGELYPHL